MGFVDVYVLLRSLIEGVTEVVSAMQNLQYTIATQDNLTFINETYNENIESLHGVHRSLDIWKQLLAEKDSIYYIVWTTVPVAWFRIDFT